MNSTATKTKRPLRAKLLFNQGAGRSVESAQQLLEILDELQKQDILPEVTLGYSYPSARQLVQRALKDGTKLVIAAGGDGTVSKLAAATVGSPLTMGILPTGTHNNMALNLGIPSSIPDAVSLLRSGSRVKIDMGSLAVGNEKRWFTEMLTLGLWSDLLSAAGQQQHGDLSKMGELLSTFAAATPFKIRMTVDSKKIKEVEAYMVLIANAPYIGPNLHVDRSVSYNDGYLDVFVFSDMTKLNLVSYALRSLNNTPENETIPSYRVKTLTVTVSPKTNIMADGLTVGEGERVKVKIHPRALTVLAGSTRGKGPRRAEVAELKQTK